MRYIALLALLFTFNAVAADDHEAMIKEYLDAQKKPDVIIMDDSGSDYVRPDFAPEFADALQLVAESNPPVDAKDYPPVDKVYLTGAACDIHFVEPTPFKRELIATMKDGSKQIGCYYRHFMDGNVYFVVGDIKGIFTWDHLRFKPVPKGEEVLRPTEVSL
jgi:hypothetical protein